MKRTKYIGAISMKKGSFLLLLLPCFPLGLLQIGLLLSEQFLRKGLVHSCFKKNGKEDQKCTGSFQDTRFLGLGKTRVCKYVVNIRIFSDIMQDRVAQEAHSFHTIQKSLSMRSGHLKVVYLEAFLYTWREMYCGLE